MHESREAQSNITEIWFGRIQILKFVRFTPNSTDLDDKNRPKNRNGAGRILSARQILER
jgi:hypothetical protein